jgi:small neutral amino acid transporter SnatA (MarC family)
MFNGNEVVSSVILLFILLNPFLIVIYLIDLVQELKPIDFSKIIFRAGAISFIVFCLFAITKDLIFENVIQANFASFQIFGGIIFLFIGIQFVFKGVDAVRQLRGKPNHIVGSIAMPILIGPGSISASIVIGEKLEIFLAILSIFVAVLSSLVIMILLKILHDFISSRKEKLIERYIEIMGRITALIVGTFSIEMILQGLMTWIKVL